MRNQVGRYAEVRALRPLVAGVRSRRRDLAPERRPRARVQRADVALLTTLAGSLSVALENARLFDETRQRNAELAIINSVQQGLAAKLDMQAIYELVGDKIQEIFDAQVVDIGIYDLAADLMRFPYTIERGVRFGRADAAHGYQQGRCETRQPLLINQDMRAGAAAVRQRRAHTEPAHLGARSCRYRRRRGVGRDLAAEPRHENAFSE